MTQKVRIGEIYIEGEGITLEDLDNLDIVHDVTLEVTTKYVSCNDSIISHIDAFYDDLTKLSNLGFYGHVVLEGYYEKRWIRKIKLDGEGQIDIHEGTIEYSNEPLKTKDISDIIIDEL